MKQNPQTFHRLPAKFRLLLQQILELVLQRDGRVVSGSVLAQGSQQLTEDIVHALLHDSDAPGLEHPNELDLGRRQEDRRRSGGTGSRGSTDSMNVIPRADWPGVL